MHVIKEFKNFGQSVEYLRSLNRERGDIYNENIKLISKWFAQNERHYSLRLPIILFTGRIYDKNVASQV